MAAKSVISKKDIVVMNETACSIKGVTDNLRTQLTIISDVIRANEKSKMEYDRTLGMLLARRDDLEKRVKKNEEWGSTYDNEVGPFAERYNAMTADIGVIYEKAKIGHKKGIQLLKDEFGYHPEFKKPGNDFTGTPFSPK